MKFGTDFYFFFVSMLEKIKSALFSKYGANDKVGLFFSIFDENGALLTSNGVIKTDKPLEKLLETLYRGIIEKYQKQIKVLVFDVVVDIEAQNDIQKLLMLSPQQYGVFLVETEGQNSGMVLPGTKGISTMQQALASVKQKFGLKGNVSLFVFKTDRIVVNI